MNTPHTAEIAALLGDSARRIFSSIDDTTLRQAEEGQWPDSLWQQVEHAGFTMAFVSELAGGFGVASNDAFTLLRTAGFHGVPLPLAETMLANRLLTEAGLAPVEGAATLPAVSTEGTVSLQRHNKDWHLKGYATGLPWARHVGTLVLLVKGGASLFVVSVDRSSVSIETDVSLCGLPMDRVTFDIHLPSESVGEAPPCWTFETLTAASASLLVPQMAGALDRILEMTVRYANERAQFGKPIGRQQAVQQMLATLAGQIAACGAAADIAGEGFDSLNVLAIAAAKSRAGEAAGIAAPIAHQVHGAIGFTNEHRLHFFTKRLWAWRDECGSERHWNALIGSYAIAAGADRLWPFITSIGAKLDA